MLPRFSNKKESPLLVVMSETDKTSISAMDLQTLIYLLISIHLSVHKNIVLGNLAYTHTHTQRGA